MRRPAHALMVALLVAGQPLSPATIEVGGACALADAIAAANTDTATGGCAAGSGADVLELTEDVLLTQALPQVEDSITLAGNNFTIGRDPAAPEFRILDLQVDGSVALENVTVANGSAALNGGGIYNQATSLSLTNTRITDNVAAGNGGGIMNGDLSALLWITNSTLSGNQADGRGGALYQGWGAETRIQGSTLSGNSAGYTGGAVYQGGYSYLSATNTTISGNTAVDAGGGIYASFYSYETNLISSTVLGNSAAEGGGVVWDVALYSGTDGLLADSVLLSNAGGNCQMGPGFVDVDDLGGNFDDDGTCLNARPAAAGTDLDVALADNGGPTLTHAILPGSVLIQAGGPCGVEEDQRGFPRGPICDSGALQFGAAPVGGTLTDIRGISVVCTNTTTAQSVSFPLAGGVDSWNCEQQGLDVGSGDTVVQSVLGGAIDGAGGSVIGLAAERVSCRNNTTGQLVNLNLTSGTSWDCVEAGLTVSAGDRIRMISRGQVP